MQLNFAEGDFIEMWQWTVDSAEQPTAQLNAQAYNEIDGIAYGLFSASDSFEPEGVTAYLCRFSDSQNSSVCLCEAPRMGNAAAITADGNYYLGYKGGEEIHMLPAVHSIPYPPGSPVAVSSLSPCSGMTQVLQGRGTGGVIDISNWGLTGADMEAFYGLPTDCTECYMTAGVWTVDVAGTPGGNMLMVGSPFATGFAFSRFGLSEAPPRDVAALTGRKFLSNAPFAVASVDGEDESGDVA